MKDDTPDVIAILDDARLEEIIRLRVDNAKLRVALELTSFQLDRLVHRTNMPAILGSLTFAHEAISIAKRTLEETK